MTRTSHPKIFLRNWTAFHKVVFLEEAQLCVLDWTATSAYSMTLLVLVFLPTIVTVFNTGYKIISAMRNPDQMRRVAEQTAVMMVKPPKRACLPTLLPRINLYPPRKDD
ncbi:hypothetical protein KIN20_020132 [Parelaphostrongylus tenuis]|uniref:Uncharacterized protein n=1 Tax=Parelaphostrongylus tenuis TaxID=148309 RepID=A0AAD5MM06_PARTN|nr:hypothetical protein KIN20_020132 [Parelaphostrongylus tenuis]